MGPLCVCRVVSSHGGGLMASGGRSYGQFGKADGVTGAGVCCCFKHLKIPFGVFHFLSSICRLIAFRTNETTYRFS